MDRYIDKWMDRRMDGWIDREADGWMDGWMGGLISHWLCSSDEPWLFSWSMAASSGANGMKPSDVLGGRRKLSPGSQVFHL